MAGARTDTADRIRARFAAGARQCAIARELGITEGRVSRVLNPTPARERRGEHSLIVSRDVFDRLRPEAKRRRIPVTEIAQRILETVGRDGLFNAVLDDGEA